MRFILENHFFEKRKYIRDRGSVRRSKMKQELSLDEIKKVEFELLKEIDGICSQEGLRYSLAGGTLLGAIRHKGFIPWDDDIDIAMPRSDYEKFISYCKSHDTNFGLLAHELNINYRNLFAKVYNKDTIIFDDTIDIKDTELGIYVDIFPLDGLGCSEKDAKKQFFSAEIEREILDATNWIKFSRSKTHKWYVEPLRLLVFILSRTCNANHLIEKIEKKNGKYDFDKSEYAGCLCGSYRLKEIMRKEVFSNYMDVPFEGGVFKGFRDYNDYLSRLYGDYMKLPSEDNRVTHHTFKAYFKEDK